MSALSAQKTYLGRPIKTEPLSVQRNIVFNTIGSLAYQGCLWLITVLVVTISGNYKDAGVLAYAMALGNIFFTIAVYAMRTYQVSDVEGRYSQPNYIAFRIVTILIAFIVCTVYSIATAIPNGTIIPTACYLLFKADESFSIVCYGAEQRSSRMDYIGISQLLRGFAALLAFTLLLYLSKSLSIAILGMFAGCCLVTLLYDLPHMAAFGTVAASIDKKSVLRLLRQCLPGVLATLFLTSVVSITRQRFGLLEGTEELGKYASVATPAVIIQAMAGFLYAPFIEPLSQTWHKGNVRLFYQHFIKVCLTMLAIMLCLSAAIILGGPWFLVKVYGSSISPYVYLLPEIAITTVQIAFLWLCSDVLIIQRCFRGVLAGNAVSFVVAVATMNGLIAGYGMDGINYTLIVSYGAGLIVSFTAIAICTRKKAR